MSIRAASRHHGVGWHRKHLAPGECRGRADHLTDAPPDASGRGHGGRRAGDGLTALGYVRSRAKTSDYHRMTRQRCVVGALIDQMTPAGVLANYLPLIGLISNHITTDIPLDRMDDFIVLGERLDTSRIVTVNFIPPEYPRGPAPIAQVREAVSRALQGTANETNSLLAPSLRRATLSISPSPNRA